MSEIPFGAEHIPSDKYKNIIPIHESEQNGQLACIVAFGIHKQTDKWAAIKLRDPFAWPKSAERLKTEADLLETIQHEQFNKIVDLDLDAEYPHIATEWVPDSVDSCKWFEKHEDHDLAAELFLSSARALAVLFELRTAHRDVKHANILTDFVNPVKMIDLEFAQNVDQPDTLTPAGRVVGTPGYTAPERIRQSNNLERIEGDQYSLGIVFGENLSGQEAFMGPTEEVPYRNAYHAPNFYTRARRIPREYLEIAERATERDPDDRYESPYEMIEATEKAIYERQIKAGKAVRALSHQGTRLKLGWANV